VRVVPAIAALLIGALVSQLEITVVGTAMPDITAELHDHERYPWVFAAYLAAYSATVPAAGMIADTFGRRRAYLLSLGLLGVGAIICAASTSMAMLIVGRLFQGAGAGSIAISAQTIMGDLFSIEQRARVQGYMSAVLAAGTAIGPALGGFFVTHASWRWAFLVALPVVVVAAGLFLYGYAESPRSPGARPMNWRGALLLTLTLGALLSAFAGHQLDPRLLALAAALAVPFLLFERRASRPILPPDLFRSRTFLLPTVTVALLTAVQFTILAFMPLYLQGALGMAPTAAGYLQGAPVAVLASLAAFTTGRIITRLGYHVAIRLGACMLLAAPVCAAAAAYLELHGGGGTLGPALLVIAGQSALGASLGLAVTGAMISIQNQVAHERRGTATASLQVMRGIAAAVAPVVVGAAYLASIRDQGLPIPPEQFLNQKALATLDPAAVAVARDGLGVALRALLGPLIACGALTVLAAWLVPRTRPAPGGA
jgi:MFS family permease